MRRALYIAICLTLGTLGTNNPAQEPPDIHKLFAQLNELGTTDRAAIEILKAASEDTSARQYIVRKLPGMINKQKSEDEIWQNAVRLAGQLKASETIPPLLKALSLGPAGGPMNTTFGVQMRLDDDIVAKALSQIGDPAVPAVTNLLKSGERKARRRAVLILLNMDSAASRKVLQDQVQRETDPDLRDFIERSLHS